MLIWSLSSKFLYMSMTGMSWDTPLPLTEGGNGRELSSNTFLVSVSCERYLSQKDMSTNGAEILGLSNLDK